MSVTIGYELVNVRLSIQIGNGPEATFEHETVRLVMPSGYELAEYLAMATSQMPDLLSALDYGSDDTEVDGIVESIEIATDEVVLLIDDEEESADAEPLKEVTGSAVH